jgi:hypothetical protein
VLWPAPLSFKNFLLSSAAPIIIRPEELAVNLLRPYQVFQLFEARKRPGFKDIFRHVDPLEKIVKLLRPPSHVPPTSEPGQMFANLLAKAATHAAQKPPLDVSNASQLRDLAQSAARIFGWDKSLASPAVHFNQLCITQEQLEQIRQLRVVPEPEQLQERKNNEH